MQDRAGQGEAMWEGGIPVSSELNARVAEAMGCRVEWFDHRTSDGVERVPCCGCKPVFGLFPHGSNDDWGISGALIDFSGDDGTAIRLLDALYDRGWVNQRLSRSGPGSGWQCWVGRRVSRDRGCLADAGTLAEAICECFLVAMEGEE